MGYAELNGKYQALRTELDAAYAVWNSSAIDRIAEKIAEVERALASTESGRHGAAVRRQVPGPVFADLP